ncbi:MAG: hypothetical protein HY673_00635 [Chloroflexi bacterium]|nr:hypothetical protein [Chloroflexota bacterium]
MKDENVILAASAAEESFGAAREAIPTSRDDFAQGDIFGTIWAVVGGYGLVTTAIISSERQ